MYKHMGEKSKQRAHAFKGTEYTLLFSGIFFYKGDNFCDFVFAFLHTHLPVKRVYPTKDDLLPFLVQ